MTLRPNSKLNLAPIMALAFSALCWLCLYAVFADFAELGLQMMTGPSLLRDLVGVTLIGLHALGLLFLFALAGAAVAVLVRNVGDGDNHHREVNGTSH